MKVDRIISILCRLSERPRSVGELIGVLADESVLDWRRFSRETIYRDIRHLKERGFEIEYCRKSRRYILKNSPITLALAPGELVALAVACRSIPEDAGLPYAKELGGALNKISSVLSPGGKRTLTVDPRFRLRLASVVNYGPHLETIETIRRSIIDNRQIEIVYYSVHSDKEERRVVDPYELYFSEGGVRLEGYCHLKDEILEFRVDRVRKVKALSVPIARMRHGESFEFTLWLDEKITKAIGDRFPDQTLELNEDGSSVLTASARNSFRLILQVLSYGERAIILEPDFLRKQMAATVKAMAELY